MCNCTPEIRTPFCGREDCLPPASREPTESLFVESVMAEFDQRDKAEQLDAWERGLAQYSHRSDSSGYAGRMGLEVLAELRATESARLLATDMGDRWARELDACYRDLMALRVERDKLATALFDALGNVRAE